MTVSLEMAGAGATAVAAMTASAVDGSATDSAAVTPPATARETVDRFAGAAFGVVPEARLADGFGDLVTVVIDIPGSDVAALHK